MSVWDDVKSRVEVDQVIGQYIQVNSIGSNLKAKCPFHNEKSASFIISKSKQIWHCFGCGLGGDVFGFVAQIENISKYEALQKLASQAGISLDSYKKHFTSSSHDQNGAVVDAGDQAATTQNSTYSSGLKHLAWAAKLYHQILLKEIQKPKSVIKEYLLKRGFTLEHIQLFQLGVAPDSDLLLGLSSQKKGISLPILMETGLVVDKNTEENNLQPKLRDKFKQRLLVPIANDKGQVVGFTGRLLNDDPNRPKYLNSPQTPWFNKGEILFGLNLARKNIYQKKEVILVEGHLDLISAFTRGWDNILASGGTSITETQLRKIKRLTTNLTLGLDNDEAGINAAYKVFGMASLLGLNVNQLIIPSKYKDLDEYASDGDTEKEALQTIYYPDYYFAKSLHFLVATDSKIQKQAILEALNLISHLDNISQEQYLKRLSDIVKIPISKLRSNLKTNLSPKDIPETSISQSASSSSGDTHILINLKAWLCVYLFLPNLPENNSKQPLKSLIQASWFILQETGLLPHEINQDLEIILSKYQLELQLIWDEELGKKIYQRPDYPFELVRSIDNLILKRRNLGLLSQELNETLFEYDVLRQQVISQKKP